MTVVTPRGRAMRTAALFISTVLASGLVAPAFAQDVPSPPMRVSEDDRGVNLKDGVFGRVKGLAMSIGSSSSGLDFSSSNREQSWRYVINSVVGGVANGSVDVVVGQRTLRFDRVNGVYVNPQNTGETLTANTTFTSFTLTMRDGTIIVFDMAAAAPLTNFLHYYNKRAIAAGNYILKPNGERLTFKYRTLFIPGSEGAYGLTSWLRLRSVVSSNGYMLKLEYPETITNSTVMSKATLLNLGIDYCNPDADVCAGLTQIWPSITYSKTTTGSSEVATETDNLNRTTTYEYNNTKLTGMRRPSSSTNNVAIGYGTDGRVSSVTAEGLTWQYAWSMKTDGACRSA